jgi:glycosyltransferase involved in cell wall biosynthesis
MLQRIVRGIEVLLMIILELKSKGFKPLLLIVGEGRKDWIFRLAEKYQAKENILIYARQSPEFLAYLYKSSDFIILPPIEFLLPTKFFESLVFGVIPIVWCKSKDILDVLRRILPSDFIRFLYYYEYSPQEVSTVIEKLLENKKIYEKIKKELLERGKFIVMKHHINGLKSLYKSLWLNRDK